MAMLLFLESLGVLLVSFTTTNLKNGVGTNSKTDEPTSCLVALLEKEPPELG